MRNDSFINECVSSITELESVTMESQMDVLCSTIDAYDKMSTIYEEATNGTDQFMIYSESYEYFEESEKTFGDKFKEHFDEGNVIKSILMFPINLIKMLINQIKKLFNHKEMTRAEKVGEFFKSNGGKIKEFCGKLWDFISDPENKGPITICGIVVSAATIAVFREKIMEIGKKFFGNVKELVYNKGVTTFFHKFDEKELTEILGKEYQMQFIKSKIDGKEVTELETTIDLEAIASFLELFNNVTRAYGRVMNKNKISNETAKKVKKYAFDLKEAKTKKIISKESHYYTIERVTELFAKIYDTYHFFENNENEESAENTINMLTEMVNSFGSNGNSTNEYSVFDFDSDDYYYQEADETNTPAPENKDGKNENNKPDENKTSKTDENEDNKTRNEKTKAKVSVKQNVKRFFSANYKTFKEFLKNYQDASACVTVLYKFISNNFVFTYNKLIEELVKVMEAKKSDSDAEQPEQTDSGETPPSSGETPPSSGETPPSNDSSTPPTDESDKDATDETGTNATSESYYFTDDDEEEYDLSTTNWYSR